MKIIADTHCHTIASTHAYATLSEMVHAAFLAGLYSIAITDHGYTMPGAPGTWYFQNLTTVPRLLEGVLVLRGAEANVIDYNGSLDLMPKDYDHLDWIVASMHEIPMPKEPSTVELCTQAWLNVAKNPRVNVIGHSGSVDFEYDYEAVLPEFGKNGKLVEINEASFTGRSSSVPNCTKIAKLCKKYRVPIIVNSDSHFHTTVGKFDQAIQLLKEIDFPEELVVNSSKERFNQYLKEYTSVFTNM